MRAFLDTDICVAFLRGKEPKLVEQISAYSMSEIAIPAVVVAELWVGVEKSAHPENAQRKLEIFLRNLSVTAFDSNAARIYGRIRSHLEKKGTTIGANDLLIASTVLADGAKLITRNRREYERVPRLRIEVW